MNELEELYQEYLDMEAEERNEIALQVSSEIFHYLVEKQSEDEVVNKYVTLYSILCCVDGEVTEIEYELFKFLTGSTSTFEEFYEVVKNGSNEEVIEEFFIFASNQGPDFITAIFVLAVSIFTSKGTLTVEEQEFIYKYLM